MTLTRKLASALCLAFSFITLSSNAQVDPSTGNLINYGTTPTDTTSTWNNGVYVNQLCFQAGQAGNCGPNPSVRPGGYINFSYGTADLNQVVNINRALAAGGSGVQLSGFNFSFIAKNGNGWDDGRQDYLAAYVKFYNAGGSLVANYDYSAQTNQRYNWTGFSFSETFANPTAASNYSNARVGFVGRDNNYWAGNYGPEIYNVAFSLKYRVDPCATNPAYSPNCAGFKDVLTSNNLVPYPDGYAVYGSSINQSYAINTALAAAGSAAQIHGFQWGYVANANGPYCAFSFIVCWDQRDPSVTTNVNITNSAGASLYNITREYRSSYNTTNYSYLFPSSQQMSTLGNFNFTATTNDAAYVGSMWSRALYTADPCAVNPLSSPTCPGYAVAFAKTITATAPAPAPAPLELATAAPALAEAAPALANPAPQPAQSPQPAPAQDTTQSTSVAQADPAQPAPTGAPGPAGGPAQTTASSTSSSSSGSSSSSAGPSKLAMSVLKSAQDKDKATQNAAVQNAAKTLEGSMQSSQASSNAAISMNQDMSANSAVTAANFASQSTQTSIQSSMQTSQQQTIQQSSAQTQQSSRMIQQAQQVQQDSQQTQVQVYSSSTQTQQSMYTPPQQVQQDTQSTQVTMLKPPSQVVEVQQQTNIGTGITIGRNMFAYNPLTLSSSSIQSMTPQQPIQMYQPRFDSKQYEIETPQAPIASFGGAGKAGNPLSEIMMQQRFEMMQNNIAQPASSVNRNVQPNELAGGIDIASMATIPTGFSAYSFVLKDAAFYEPKEVYKNQRTVDNERVLRGLTRGSDSLHQQMVDQQYKLGN